MESTIPLPNAVCCSISPFRKSGRFPPFAAAGLDVLSIEPMNKENPLRKIKDSTRLLITPHIAWASVEARTRLMKTISDQIKEFFGL